MPHEFESGFFVTRAAWHGLGKVFREQPSNPLRESGLDWIVETVPIELENGIPIPSHKAVTRLRAGVREVLGVVRNQYTPEQNARLFDFASFFTRDGDCTYEAAGSLRGGKLVWVLLRIAGGAEVLPGDSVIPYLVIINSHDGTLKLTVKFITTRLVCMNTCRAALAENRESLTFRHTAHIDSRFMAARETVNLARRNFSADVERYKLLAAHPVSEDTFEKRYIPQVFQTEKLPRAFPQLQQTHRETGLTGWGAFNAVTTWIDHQRGRSADSRVQGSWLNADMDGLRERALLAATLV